ncbi:metacaspase-4-like [Lotus japonicus]|uniref:metacaspase-4-like n=1 Tax=Lotus japonicus TaxID=34305 RepID=UPI002588D27B|nr:metacaspase-4-like [Lotus japonicus]
MDLMELSKKRKAEMDQQKSQKKKKAKMDLRKSQKKKKKAKMDLKRSLKMMKEKAKMDLLILAEEAERDLISNKRRKISPENMDLITSSEKKKEKKAVLIGLKHPDPQMNDIDVKEQILRMKDLLINHRGFSEDNITLMIQDEQHEDHENQPTEINIRVKLCRLVDRADPGDILFVHLIAYGCSDGVIITSDQDHIPDSYFRALIWNAGKKGCDLTFVSDCLIAPHKCTCPITPFVSATYEEMDMFLKSLIPENYHLFPRIDYGMLVSTNLSSVDEDDKKTTQDDDVGHGSSRIVLLTPFQRDQNAATTTTTTQEEALEEEEEVEEEEEALEEEEVPFDQNASNQEIEEEDSFDQSAAVTDQEKEEEEEEVEEEQVPFDQMAATNQEEEEEDSFDQNAAVTDQEKEEEEKGVEEEQVPFDQNAATNQEEEEEEEEDGEFEPAILCDLTRKEKEHYLKTGSIVFFSDSEEENQLSSEKGSFTMNDSYVSELFFPPPKGTTTSPDHTSYGAFTKALLDVIEDAIQETDGWVTNLDLAKKAMSKLGEMPGLSCNRHQHANASFVC